MNKYHEIDLATWQRAELFKFYQSFSDPCFNVTVKVDAGNIWHYAKDRGESFFLISLYAILHAANQVPQVRQRILNSKPVEFEKIAAMTPIMTKTEMFSELMCEYFASFAEFKAQNAPKVELARNEKNCPKEDVREDFICASCVPWLHFEAITQAEYKFGQTIPILAWGKFQDGKIPISVKFNHSFMDGLYVSRFFDAIQTAFTFPDSL